MGEEAGDVLTTTKIEEADRQKYDKVIDKFDGFFKVQRNTVFERAKFNRRNQRDDELVEQYITALFHLRETCDFGDGALADELLRDRIIVGIRDTKLAETLMLDPDMSLDKVMRPVRQKGGCPRTEQTTETWYPGGPHCRRSCQWRREATETAGAQSTRGRKPETGQRDRKTTAYANDVGKTMPPQTGVPPEEQPVLNATGKVTFRLSKSVATTTTTTDESFFLGTLKSDDTQQTSWTTNLLLKGQTVNFKLDTGAEVTVINRQTLQRLPRIQLQPTSKTLLGPAQHPLKVTGQFETTLTKDDRTTIFFPEIT